MIACKLCNRELASEPRADQEPVCQICAEEVLRVCYALVHRGPQSIRTFIANALLAKPDITSDAEFVSALTDYTERLKGHSIPCDKCNSRRWSKDIL